MVDEGIEKGLKKEKDKAKREQGEKVLKVLAPSLKAGELDLVVRLLGPDKGDHMTVVGAAKVKDGADLDQAIRDVVKSLPEAQRSKVTFDAESAGAVKIHRIDAKEMDAKGRKVFGDNPFFFAISQHVAVVAGGPDGLSALKDLLAAKPQQAPPFVLNASLAQLVLFVSKQTGRPEAVKAIQDAIDKSPKGHDQLHISVEGGNALTARISANAEALKLIAVLGEKAQGAFKEVGAEIKKGDDK
jgi:hypothetical protein